MASLRLKIVTIMRQPCCWFRERFALQGFFALRRAGEQGLCQES
jgi:hypothetical protein